MASRPSRQANPRPRPPSPFFSQTWVLPTATKKVEMGAPLLGIETRRGFHRTVKGLLAILGHVLGEHIHIDIHLKQHHGEILEFRLQPPTSHGVLVCYPRHVLHICNYFKLDNFNQWRADPFLISQAVLPLHSTPLPFHSHSHYCLLSQLKGTSRSWILCESGDWMWNYMIQPNQPGLPTLLALPPRPPSHGGS